VSVQRPRDIVQGWMRGGSWDDGAPCRTSSRHRRARNSSPGGQRRDGSLMSTGDHTGGVDGLLDQGLRPAIYVTPSLPDALRRHVEGATEIVTVAPGQSIADDVFTTGEIGGAVPEQARRAVPLHRRAGDPSLRSSVWRPHRSRNRAGHQPRESGERNDRGLNSTASRSASLRSIGRLQDSVEGLSSAPSASSNSSGAGCLIW
jgi:hypothetical protein